MPTPIELAERGIVPDTLIKFGIRRLLQQRLNEGPNKNTPTSQDHTLKFISELRSSPIALETKAANEQHYELPPEFFQIALGKHLKYSSGFYDNGATNLDEAEAHMLALTAERAEIKDGMKVLDLGCGWGSLSLWIAEHFPNCQVHSVSNSAPQRLFIEATAKARGLNNIKIMTADMNVFQAPDQYDRVVSVEMFEHMRNYEKLMANISTWLKKDGKLFVHIFCHKVTPYYFETEGDDNWMGAHFFTGGIMPSNHLLLYFQNNLKIDQHWVVNGTNYGKTSFAWLDNMDARKDEVLKIFKSTYGDDAQKWVQRWRIFFMSCGELFNYNGGEEWYVSHYLFSPSLNQKV